MMSMAATMSTSLTMRQATAARGSRAARRAAPRAAATTGTKLADIVKPGVVSGKDSMAVLKHAKDNGYAIPAVNCTCTSVINACLEAAKEADAPIMVQFSNGGGYYIAGKGLDNTDEKAAIAGTIAGALHTRAIADLYGVPVFLHTDHCSKKLLPWFDGLLEANEKYYAEHGVPLFSSHMLDLSEEPIEENMEICKKYLERMSKIDCVLEIEIGITGGEEDGVDNTDVAKEELYSKPEEIDYVYEQLSSISPLFTVAAAFGNVHGVYKPGNVELTPSILGNAQKYIKEKRDLDEDKPVLFVFHGGSGSSREEIQEAIDYGVVKMNIDTDTQWSMWEGIKAFEADKHDYLQGQIGNPEGDDKPNKKYYDPRAWLRGAEQSTVDRIKVAFDDLKATGACSK